MNRTSVLHAPSWAHNGEFIASGTIWNFSLCREGTAETTSAEAITYLQNIRKLAQISTAGAAQDITAPTYMAYKWPTEDDYYERNGLSNKYITTGEGVVGLLMVPGIRIQEYVGTDYTNDSGVALGGLVDLNWSAVTNGTMLFSSNNGQLTTATDNLVARGVFIEYKGDWVTWEVINPRYYP